MPASNEQGDRRRQASRDQPSPCEATMVRSAVVAVLAGNREAFGRLVQCFQARLFGFCLMVTRHRSGAEEVVQDAFVRAFKNLHLFDQRRPFYPWLATIGFRLAQNWLVRNTRMSRREGADLAAVPSQATTSDPLDELISDQTGRQLWRRVEALPAGERSAVLLYYRQEMKVSEVAKVLGVTQGTVKTLLFRARQHLREVLEGPSSRQGETRVDL